MSDINKILAKPSFDSTLFMRISGLARIEDSLLKKIRCLWLNWKSHLFVYLIANEEAHESKRDCCLIYLDESVEVQLQEMWAVSPSEAFLMHCLAATMITGTAELFLSKKSKDACLPLPLVNENLIRRLDKLGIEWREGKTFNREYIIFTYYPFKEGCQACSLKPGCPKTL